MGIYRESIYKIRCAKPEIFEWYSKKGAVSIFIYSRAVLKNGKLGLYDDENKSVRSVAKGGEIWVPACFFEKYLECAVSEDAYTVTVGKGKKALCAKLGESELSVGAKSLQLIAPVFALDGYKYLPALATAKALGISARAFDGGKLIVFAREEMLDEIERDTDLEVSASYATLGKYDASKFTKEDFEAVKNKWRTVLVGNEEMNDVNDPDLCEKLDEISTGTASAWETLNKESDRVILWGTEAPSVSHDLTRQYANIWALAKGYATFGSKYYKNEKLKELILELLQWMYENMYGEAEAEDRGWRSMRLFNWWDWFVGGVEPLTDTLFVMEEYLTYEQKHDYLKAFKKVITMHRHGDNAAMSRLKVFTKAALLLEDREMLSTASVDYDLTLSVTREGQGIHVDYVDWTHNYPYNMMYGFNKLSRTGFVGALLGGTPMEFVSPKQYELFNMAKYTFEAACYKGQGFMGFNGRGTMGTEMECGVHIMLGVLPFIGLYGEEEDRHLKRLIKRCASTPQIVKRLKQACSVYNFARLMEILNDYTIPTENDYELCHAWFTADRITQHKDDHAFFVAMSSERHPSYESINSANKRGWYTGDGAVYYYNNTDRNAYDGVNFITNPNICRRIPGTTVDDREREAWSYTCLKGWRSPRAFSGVLDVDKKYGMAAFEYESYHYEGHEADGTNDGDGGGGLTFWENDLVAKKSYFLFDKELVCLGTGINSTMDANVLTTVEHRRLVKNSDTLGIEDVYVDGELMPKGEYERFFKNPTTAHLEGFAGYVFPSGGNLRASRYMHVADASYKDGYFKKDPDEELYRDGKPFFEINLYHGKNPKDASYEYVVLPNATKEETEEYGRNPQIEIVKNTNAVQAVRKPSLGLTLIAFYEPCECMGVKVDKPCLVTLYEKDGATELAVSEPTRKVDSITVTLNGRYTPKCVPLRVKTDTAENLTVLTVDVSDTTGEAVRTELLI